jgi:hypothetical protein
VVGTDALSGVITFLQSLSGMEEAFRRRALDVSSLLRGEDTVFALVASPTADAIGGAETLARELARLGVGLGLVIENRVPPWFGPATEELFPDMAAEHSAASAVLDGFATVCTALHPRATRARAHEAAGDIHDIGGITALADELAS